MIIDGHAHMNHISWLEYLEKQGGEAAKRSATRMRDTLQSRPHSLDVRKRLEQLDRNNIDFQVVTPPGGGNLMVVADADRPAAARILNDGMARLMEESKGRLIAGATVSLAEFQQGGGDEMNRAINTLGLKAITVPSHVRGKPLDVPEFEAFWAQAAEIGVPVYIHPSSPEQHRDRAYEGEYDLSHNFGWPFETILSLSRLVFSGIMERYPNLKVVGHHLGGGIPFWWGRINETYDANNDFIGPFREKMDNLSRPLFDYFSLFYYDTAVGGSGEAVRCAYDVFGPDHLLFATDAPNGPGDGEVRLATYPKVIESLGFPEEDNKKILADNVWQLLDLK